MSKLKYFIVLGALFGICLLFRCSTKGEQTNSTKVQDSIQVEYVFSESLSTDDDFYSEGYFPEEGFVPTPEIAVEIADIVLSKIYGKKNIGKQKPFLINLKNDIWLIEGQIERDLKGGVAYIEIKKSTGEILKVIHGK